MISFDKVFGPLLEELMEAATEKVIEMAFDDALQEPIEFDGGTYFGERKLGIPNGRGKLVAKDGAYFEGVFANGKMVEGYAEYSTSSGHSWKGGYGVVTFK